MSEYGDAVLRRHEDGTVTVLEAADTIAVAPELAVEAERAGAYDGGTGRLVLDTAGEYVYQFRGMAEDWTTLLFDRIRP